MFLDFYNLQIHNQARLESLRTEAQVSCLVRQEKPSFLNTLRSIFNSQNSGSSSNLESVDAMYLEHINFNPSSFF